MDRETLTKSRRTMKVELLGQEEMKTIYGGGIGCWLGKLLARAVYAIGCPGFTGSCYITMKTYQEVKDAD